jgi:hypothetical protein
VGYRTSSAGAPRAGCVTAIKELKINEPRQAGSGFGKVEELIMSFNHLDNGNWLQDISQAENFFKAIFGRQSGGFLEIRAFPSGKNKPIQRFFSIPQLGEAAAFAVRLKNQVYYSAAPRSQQRGTTDAVNTIVGLWLDGDDGALPWTNLVLTPSIVVNTGNIAGNHYQAHYLLHTPFKLNTESDQDKTIAYLKAMAVVLKGDIKSCDIARVLRVPGTYNTKAPGYSGLCRIIELNPDARYSPEEIRDAITLSLVIRHWERGQRQDMALSLAGYLAKCNVPESKVGELLEKLLSMTSDEEPRTRLAALESTYKKLHGGKKVKGYQGLAQYLDKDELQALDSLWEPPKGLSIAINGITYLERDGEIISQTARENAPPVIRTLASFTIKPKMRITLEGEGERLDTVLKSAGGEYPNLFKREAWNSKRQFLAALPSVELQYYGTDKDTQAILAMVTSKEVPIRKGTTVLGKACDLWVLREGVLSRDGWVKNPDIVYIPSEVEFDRRVRYSAIKDEGDLIRQVIPSAIILNEGKVIFPVLGWFFSTPFACEIRRRLHHYPILIVWGTHGGGKSSLLRLLWRMFGVESELFSSTETPFTFLRLFSGTSTIPIIIDEFKPFNMKEDETRLLIRFLKRLYDGEIEHRGRPDLSMVAYHLQAPVAIAGEVTPIALESAMAERVIQVNLSPDALTFGSPYVSAFNKLSSLNLGGFALPYIRWCLGADLDDLMTEALTLFPAALKEVPPRVRDNVLVMITGLTALKRFASQHGVKIAEEPFRTGITESVIGLIAELFEKGGHEEIGLTNFLETLATLAQTQRIKHGVHYTTDDANTRLYINLPDCLAEFRKFVRETSARIEVLDQRAYNRQAREIYQRKGYVLNTNTSKWFEMFKTDEGSKGKVRKCLEIDMEQLPFDTSGFEPPAKN